MIELYEGIAEAGVPVLGGDTTRADKLVLSVTALGPSERVPGRAGAQPGDLLVVTGPLGASGAAFAENRYVRPPLRIEEGRRLAQTAHAMLDISDGIARDAGHIAAPLGPPLRDRAGSCPARAGRDRGRPRLRRRFRAPGRVPEADFRVVGRCEEGEGVALLRDGRPYALTGWDHFKP